VKNLNQIEIGIMVDKLKQFITEKQTANNNSCGTTLHTIVKELNISFSETKVLLTELYNDKFIRFKKGINHDLIFLRIHQSIK
jgi:hypothetical protein